MSKVDSVLVLGGSGFLGQAVVTAAVSQGLRVHALARSDSASAAVAARGAVPLRGDAAIPAGWVGRIGGVSAIVDLTQPALPSRLTVRAVRRMARQRLAATSAMVSELAALPKAERPWWISVSGTDDLLPDTAGLLSSQSALRTKPRGFAHIGLPVRAVIAASPLVATYVYLGQMVYGPGKAYERFVVDALRSGKARMVGTGNNTLPLTQVEDAAAALVCLLKEGSEALAGRSVVTVPATPATQRDLFTLTGSALQSHAPSTVPAGLVAIVAGRINAEVMALDACCNPDILLELGFTFRHETLASGVAASLSALART